MPNKSPSINLLKNKEISFFDKFINWILTIGRLIVILTELVALSAFIYRFSLDRKLIDLHSKIKQEQTIVSYLKDNEAKYRDLQDRLLLASKFSTASKERIKIFKDIIGFTPKDMTFNNLIFYKNRVNINADVQSTPSLTAFVNSLKSYPNITSVSLDTIENKPLSNIIAVSITANLK